MSMDPRLRDWLLESDPALRWQVERDLLGAPAAVWEQTKGRAATVADMSDPTGRVPGAIALWALQLLLTACAAGMTFLETLSIASCTATSCDYAGYAAIVNTLYIGGVVLLAGSGAAILLLRHVRGVVFAPIIGILLLIALLMITYVAGRHALTLPLFGNRLA